ncbi:tyrosine-type recombinase/integrase [Paramaledivibacter caminithermalis]|jgi:integrase/recombinase XerD|uniref:Phage integrase, N-terminal SAM-like domain n=1 Tax=Paramaledivibacter caminithermalis (strain DSM 15212 / CIP 107654 / DViRD3) TaxID=1121301 RepID=A0A1M6JK18_PARC5|nr:tyrosine-type recombinase/integrase [Paramaledivibacter caminithermalis]SHJ47009.1 Phage integrase, N-terminal SAM-like domain [Paramaledivibacter caminithermalis DSM 15212]
MIEDFRNWLIQKGRSINTIKSYIGHVKNYLKWFDQSFNDPFTKLYRQNVLEFISFLINIKKLKASTINAKIAALVKLNEYLIENKIQNALVITKKDYIKIQNEYISPSTISKNDVESFRQKILENKSKRDYAIVTLLAYSGMRISEALNVKLSDVNLTTREILVRYGKGKKQRLVIINDKIVYAIKEYLKERAEQPNSFSEYLFISRESETVDRTVINRIFNEFSDKITPHTLRHFFCSYALESGWSTHEVAAQVGHTNIHTTMRYMLMSILFLTNLQI